MVEEAPWEYGDLPATLSYRGRMWVMGGRRMPGAANCNQVWSSADGANWTLVNPGAGWCPRVSPSFAVFRDRMWIMAGTENFYEDTGDTLKNDVWSSADGRDWPPGDPAGRVAEAHPRPGRGLRRPAVDPGRRRVAAADDPPQRRVVLGGRCPLDLRHRGGAVEAAHLVLGGRVPGVHVGCWEAGTGRTATSATSGTAATAPSGRR